MKRERDLSRLSKAGASLLDKDIDIETLLARLYHECDTCSGPSAERKRNTASTTSTEIVSPQFDPQANLPEDAMQGHNYYTTFVSPGDTENNFHSTSLNYSSQSSICPSLDFTIQESNYTIFSAGAVNSIGGTDFYNHSTFMPESDPFPSVSEAITPTLLAELDRDNSTALLMEPANSSENVDLPSSPHHQESFSKYFEGDVDLLFLELLGPSANDWWEEST
jgi:hypothetical protein